MAASYAFSEAYAHSSTSSCAFSPGSSALASAYGDRIVVRSTETMQVVRTWQCKEPAAPVRHAVYRQAGAKADTGKTISEPIEISSIAWSPSSSHLLVTALKARLVFVFSTSDEGDEPAAVIRAGIEGLIKAEWNENGEEVLCWSEAGLRISVYSLVTGFTAHIANPVPQRTASATQPTTQLHAHRPRGLIALAPPSSPDARSGMRRSIANGAARVELSGEQAAGSYWVTAERHKGKDWLSVYDSADQFNLVRSFPVATNEVAGVAWSPCGRWIAVWESMLEYAIHIYSPLGLHLGSFTASSPTFTGTDPGLGIRCVSWGPAGLWLGVGGWDGRVRILESDGWRCVATVAPGPRLSGDTTAVWKEPGDWYRQTHGLGVVAFDKVNGVLSVPSIRPDPAKPNPKMGISQLQWNVDGTCLLVRCDTTPTVAYIYRFLPSPEASGPDDIVLTDGILLAQPLKVAKWNPQRPRRLALCTHDPLWSGNAPALGGTKRGAEEEVQVAGSGLYVWDGDWVDEVRSEASSEAGDLGDSIVEGIAVPHPTMFTLDIKWSADGQTLSIIDKTHMCLFYDVAPPEIGGEADLSQEQSHAALETLMEESYMSDASGLDRRVSIRNTPQKNAGDSSRLSDVLRTGFSHRRPS